MNAPTKVHGALFGLAVGDALGVPVEFVERETLSRSPVRGMTGFGTYNLPPGTWSDDSSLAFCLAEAITSGFELGKCATNFIRWLDEGFWTAGGTVFDVGLGTEAAIERLRYGIAPELAGGEEEFSNGNGSLMRIIPLVFLQSGRSLQDRFNLAKDVSSITHRHPRSVLACFFYCELALQILQGRSIGDSFLRAQELFVEHADARHPWHEEVRHFNRLISADFGDLREKDISSSGYVIHTLEASIWCILNSKNYSDAVLKAVNLGGDSDTTGAVTGGLAGLIYGCEAIPEPWIAQLARKDDIYDLAKRVSEKCGFG